MNFVFVSRNYCTGKVAACNDVILYGWRYVFIVSSRRVASRYQHNNNNNNNNDESAPDNDVTGIGERPIRNVESHENVVCGGSHGSRDLNAVKNVTVRRSETN